jgi:hypothetical protein
MNLNDLTIGQAKELAALFSGVAQTQTVHQVLIGEYVIVRCRDAGVHAGILKSYNGREAVLAESRRLWYWKPANNQKYLSGCAIAGLHENSKVGAPISLTVLTETCEIIACENAAKVSISGAKVDESK